MPATTDYNTVYKAASDIHRYGPNEKLIEIFTDKLQQELANEKKQIETSTPQAGNVAATQKANNQDNKDTSKLYFLSAMNLLLVLAYSILRISKDALVFSSGGLVMLSVLKIGTIFATLIATMMVDNLKRLVGKDTANNIVIFTFIALFALFFAAFPFAPVLQGAIFSGLSGGIGASLNFWIYSSFYITVEIFPALIMDGLFKSMSRDLLKTEDRAKLATPANIGLLLGSAVIAATAAMQQSAQISVLTITAAACTGIVALILVVGSNFLTNKKNKDSTQKGNNNSASTDQSYLLTLKDKNQDFNTKCDALENVLIEKTPGRVKLTRNYSSQTVIILTPENIQEITSSDDSFETNEKDERSILDKLILDWIYNNLQWWNNTSTKADAHTAIQQAIAKQLKSSDTNNSQEKVSDDSIGLAITAAKPSFFARVCSVFNFETTRNIATTALCYPAVTGLFDMVWKNQVKEIASNPANNITYVSFMGGLSFTTAIISIVLGLSSKTITGALGSYWSTMATVILVSGLAALFFTTLLAPGAIAALFHINSHATIMLATAYIGMACTVAYKSCKYSFFEPANAEYASQQPKHVKSELIDNINSLSSKVSKGISSIIVNIALAAAPIIMPVLFGASYTSALPIFVLAILCMCIIWFPASHKMAIANHANMETTKPSSLNKPPAQVNSNWFSRMFQSNNAAVTENKAG